MLYKETTYGFDWGGVRVQRAFSDKKKGWVGIFLITKKYPNGIQVYVTKAGKIKIADPISGNEWKPMETRNDRK